jgi:hypothetical protein
MQKDHNIKSELSDVIRGLSKSFALDKDKLNHFIFQDVDPLDQTDEFILGRMKEIESLSDDEFEREIKKCGFHK